MQPACLSQSVFVFFLFSEIQTFWFFEQFLKLFYVFKLQLFLKRKIQSLENWERRLLKARKWSLKFSVRMLLGRFWSFLLLPPRSVPQTSHSKFIPCRFESNHDHDQCTTRSLTENSPNENLHLARSMPWSTWCILDDLQTCLHHKLVISAPGEVIIVTQMKSFNFKLSLTEALAFLTDIS